LAIVVKSRNESAFVALIRRAGLPDPLTNAELEGIEVDCHWPAHALVVEVDGPGHRRPRTRSHDALRDRVLRQAGYTVLRFADAEIGRRPDRVLAAVAARMDGR
jgi:very-short-patch-repair endonuclease